MAQERIVETRMDGTHVNAGNDDKGPSQDQSPDMPEKFRGKTVDEIVQAYQNLEKEHGRQSNEMGELRRLADKLILNHSQGSNSPDNQDKSSQLEDEITNEKFLEDPVGSVSKIVERAVKPIGEKLTKSQQETTLQALRQKHPNMEETVKDENFQEWVLSSPGRQTLWARASEGNFDIADELFTEWENKQSQNAGKSQNKSNNSPRDRELEAATSIGSGTSTEGIEFGGNKPKFRRADIIRLQMEDPLKYRQMQQEILDAYRDGRVI